LGGGTAAGDGFGTFFGAAVSIGRSDGAEAGVGGLAARNFRIKIKVLKVLDFIQTSAFR
jgi:hypothetical protein